MGELCSLPNISVVMEKQLQDAGIETIEQLKSVGSRAAWLRILANDPSACYNRLCGLEGAICGIRWHNLPEEQKQALKQFYTQHKPKK